MMGVGADEARRMSYWEYQARLWNWNERHKSDDGEGDPVEAPDIDYMLHRQQMLEARGIAKMVH